MKNNKKKYFLFLAVLTLLFGCHKDFLDVQPIGVINSNSFYATKADANAAVTAVYGYLNAMQLFDSWIQMDLGSIASDDAEAGGNNYQDSPIYQEIDNFTFTTGLGSGSGNHGGFEAVYGLLYKMIFYANIAIKNLPGITKKDTSATTAFINERLGEVKFLRALAYYYLVQVFGEVPLVDHVLGASEYKVVTRSSLRSVFDLMESDLQTSVGVLPLTWSASSDLGRATKGAAEALLAKVYLLESSYAHYYPNDNYSLVNPGESRFKGLKERWGDALTMAEDVINSGVYQLVGINGERYKTWRDSLDNGYRYLFTTNGNNSKESIFEIQCNYLNLKWENTRGSSYVWWSSARWYYNGTTPSTTSMWGFNVPSYSLKKEFNEEKRQPTDPNYGSLTPADPRFNVTIHMDTIGGNDSIQIGNPSNTGPQWYKIAYQASPTQYSPTAMYQAKFECSYNEYYSNGPNWSESPYDIYLLRYGDIVLVAAEAAIMTGDQAKALTYINMIRKRARMCGGPGNTAPRDLTMSDLTTTLNTPNGPVTMKSGMPQLIHERRLELAMEGYRFYDLVRWNLATKYLDGQILAASGEQVSFTSPKNDFYPIPDDEVNTSGGGLKQYPGW